MMFKNSIVSMTKETWLALNSRKREFYELERKLYNFFLKSSEGYVER